MHVLDLFSGIGGFSLGLERAGMETVAFCEIDPFCRVVLKKHWPGVPIFRDIKHVTAQSVRGLGTIDLVCGGFPCQPVSVAGARQGEADERWLWPELARVVREVKPRWGLFENVPGLLSADNGRLFAGILRDLAEIGLICEWHCIPSSAIGAPFSGDRVYILASANPCNGNSGLGIFPDDEAALQRIKDTDGASVWMEATRRSARMGNGFSDFVDRRERTEVIGNSVCPLIPEIIGRAIMANV